MIKVDHIPMDFELLGFPDANEIWAITRRELGKEKKSISEMCKEKFNKDPVYIYEDRSLRVYFVGVN